MRRLAALLTQLFIRWMPEAFTVTLLLTLFTFALAVMAAGYAPRAAIQSWGDGLWSLLEFTNQITLTLLLGYVLANTPPMQRALLRTAALARTPAAAYALACVITAVCSLVSWGLGLITAGLMARAIGESCRRQGVPVHYPLLVASAFSGFVVWHQGLTSSVGLAIATPGSFLEPQIGLIPTSQTLFTVWNAGLALFVVVTLPFVMASLRPGDLAEVEPIPEALLAGDGEDTAPLDDEPSTPAGAMERSIVPIALLVAIGVAFLAFNVLPLDEFLQLNRINFVFLMLGMSLAGSPQRFIALVAEGGRVAAPLLVLYPFYAAIKQLMADSGLAQMMVEFFISVSSPGTLPLFGFLSGGLVNLFIPSGGGQWAVQGPIMMAAAQELGADLPRTAMAVALGDQWTNLVQPLVVIPVLLISGIRVRMVMGYLLVAVFYTGLAFTLALALF